MGLIGQKDVHWSGITLTVTVQFDHPKRKSMTSMPPRIDCSSRIAAVAVYNYEIQ